MNYEFTPSQATARGGPEAGLHAADRGEDLPEKQEGLESRAEDAAEAEGKPKGRTYETHISRFAERHRDYIICALSVGESYKQIAGGLGTTDKHIKTVMLYLRRKARARNVTHLVSGWLTEKLTR